MPSRKEPHEEAVDTGKRLVSWRKQKLLTQEQVANSLGCSVGNYSNLEKGKVFISPRFLVILYQNYGLSPTWLLTGEEEVSDRVEADSLQVEELEIKLKLRTKDGRIIEVSNSDTTT